MSKRYDVVATIGQYEKDGWSGDPDIERVSAEAGRFIQPGRLPSL